MLRGLRSFWYRNRLSFFYGCEVKMRNCHFLCGGYFWLIKNPEHVRAGNRQCHNDGQAEQERNEVECARTQWLSLAVFYLVNQLPQRHAPIIATLKIAPQSQYCVRTSGGAVCPAETRAPPSLPRAASHACSHESISPPARAAAAKRAATNP